MSVHPFISICIPAYKRVDFLKRLLESLLIQTFKDFEVIVTDDSSDDSVYNLISSYNKVLDLDYKKNVPALGTPENWNAAVRVAKGQWIKIMHDDDWFSSKDSLNKFVQLIKQNPDSNFLFSGSAFVRNDKVFGGMYITKWQHNLLKKDPANLYFKNFIGPPSVTIYKNLKQIWYDRNMKWLVDVDFYMRYLHEMPQFAYTLEPLINVGYSESQVTEQVIHDKTVFVKENLMMMEKQSHNILKRVWNYDYTWRMIRNFEIRNVAELTQLYPPAANHIPKYHINIISFQNFIPGKLLRIGVISKFFMTISFLISRLKNIN